MSKQVVKVNTLQGFRNRLATGYKRGFDDYLIKGDTACNPYSRNDFARMWKIGRDECKANKKPRY